MKREQTTQVKKQMEEKTGCICTKFVLTWYHAYRLGKVNPVHVLITTLKS